MNFATNNVHGDKQENNMDLLTFPKQEEKTTPESTTLVTVLLKKHPYCVKPAVVQHQKHVCQEQERILPVVAHEALVSVRSGACLPPSEVHTVIVRRWACPASSEVHADFVRKRACPSSSEVHADIVRSFLLRRRPVLSLSLRGTNRRCVEEGLRCNPSSTEVHNDVVEVPLVHVRKRAVCNPSSSEEAAVDAEEDAGLGGWRACLSTPRETHNQRTTDANIPNCATPQSAASKHPELCATHYTTVRQSTENGTLRQCQLKRQSTVFRCIKHPELCDKRTLTCTCCQDPSVPASSETTKTGWH